MSRPRAIVLATLVLGATLGASADATGQARSGAETVEAFTEAFVGAVRAYDVDTWAELVAEDVVMMTPTGRVAEGRSAFHDVWSRAFEGRSGPNPLEVSVRESRVLGDVAAVRADYGPEEGGPVGQYVWLLERDDEGAWRLAWWIFTRGSGTG